MNDEYYMNEAYKEALKAYQEDEVPVGAIIVYNDKIIARAYNQREAMQRVTGHAETLAIEEASKVLNSWRLDDCILYTTLEPCIMCSGVIIQSRIKKVVYGASDTRWMSLENLLKHNHEFNHQPEVIGGILEEKCSCLIKNYFKKKR